MIFGLAQLSFARALPPAAPNALAGLTQVSRVNLPHVAFANLINESLYLATFDGNPLGGKDYEFIVKDASTIVKNTAPVQPTQLKGQITWPNVATKAPASVFGVDGAVIAGGFLVPGKNNGGIWFQQKGTENLVQIFAAKGFFYHIAQFYDVNQDGKMDILTCRAAKSTFGGGSGDLTYLQPVDRANPLGLWTETVIGKGCDTFFVLADMNNDGFMDIVSAEFWGSKLTLIESANGRFDDSSLLKRTTIDSTAGQMFSVEMVDVNGDGVLDILATNHDGKGKGSVFAYEVPKSVADPWARHVLATDFPVLQKGIGQAAPGAAEAFYANKGDSGKPMIVVAGDASQKAYVLTPNSSSAADWSFTKNIVHDCGCTVGGIAVGDADQNGKTELYIPCYDAGYLVTYSF